MSRRVGILVLLVGMFAAMLAASSISSAATPYYVDCTDGNDANDGTSPSTAWNSLAKADSLVLDANTELLFKRDCTWSGSISLDGTGGFVGAYGNGDMPVIENNSGTGYVFRLNGSNLTVDNLYAEVTMPAVSVGCQNQPKGDTKAFLFAPDSTRNVVRNSKATGAWAAVVINDTSSFNRVHHNTFEDNNAMLPNDGASSTDDAGAFGVLARGTDNQIDHNTFSGQKACSVDYGSDGSAVEIYNGQRNRIHHNISIESNVFTEVGGKDRQAQDNTFNYNLVYSRSGKAHGVLVHGKTLAIPTIGTVVQNNTFYLTSPISMGVNCFKCGTEKRLTMKNNIMWVTDRPFIGDAAGVTEDYNMWNKQPGTLEIGAHSKIADPLFASPSTNDFHLQSTSPAIDAGTYLGGGTDLDGNPVPQGVATDMGAYTTASAPPVDTTPPETTIDSGPSASVNVGLATFAFSSNEANSTFECSLDSPAYKSCTSPQSYTVLANGPHTFSVRATDTAGNIDPTAESRTWSVDDTTAPTVDALKPTQDATDVAAASDVLATFSEAMDASTISGSTFTLDKQNADGTTTTPVAAAVSYDSASKKATLNPDVDLDPSATYTATVKGGADGVKDAAGNPLAADIVAADKSWSFTTASAPPLDTVAPTVTGFAPTDRATEVAVAANTEATFSEDMDASTLSPNTFTLVNQGDTTATAVPAAVTYDSQARKATLNPDADLDPATTYTATVKGGLNGAKDTAGNPLQADMSWSFTTAAAAPPPADATQPTINLSTPPNGETYTLNQAVNAQYSCTDETGGSGLASCAAPVANGAAIHTSTMGTKDFTVTATDIAGNTASVTHSYMVKACTISGTSGNDSLKGTSTADVICGLGGNDTIQGLGGNDLLQGGGGGDMLVGDPGDDTQDGGLGTDTSSFSGTAAVVASLAAGTASGQGSDTLTAIESLTGSSANDTITGDNGPNKLDGSGGNDTQSAGAGNDNVIGGKGADNLFGEDGDDTVNSKDSVKGNDSLDGGPGTDTKVTDATEKSIVNFP